MKRDLGAVPLSRFAPKVAASWKKKQLGSRLSASTVRKHLASWRKVRSRAAEIMCRDAEELHDPSSQNAGDELEKGRFHDLRHTHATELLRAGVHIKIVAERIGDRESTVMQTYSHVLPDMQESAAAAIEPMLRGLLV